jgi:hypothetical protein
MTPEQKKRAALEFERWQKTKAGRAFTSSFAARARLPFERPRSMSRDYAEVDELRARQKEHTKRSGRRRAR